MIDITYSKTIKHDLDHFEGRPSVCVIIITDIKCETYESEIHLPKDWDSEGFTKSITGSLILCDNTPASIYVKSLKLKD